MGALRAIWIELIVAPMIDENQHALVFRDGSGMPA